MHWHRAEALEVAAKALVWAEGKVLVALPPRDAELLDRDDLAVDEKVFASEIDCCLSLGGDGTILRSAALLAPHEVPIIGVNGGRLGYLAEDDPANLQQILNGWLADSLVPQERMMLAARVEGETPWKGYALNEAVLYRSESGRSMSLSAAIAGKSFLRYMADGVILATPTGSTAYSLSAGGPVVEPNFEALVLTPVAAHTAFNRSLVLAPTTEVALTVEGYRPAVLSLDGRTALDLEPGQTVICKAADHKVKFLRYNPKDFHAVLKDKFGLKDPAT